MAQSKWARAGFLWEQGEWFCRGPWWVVTVPAQHHLSWPEIPLVQTNFCCAGPPPHWDEGTAQGSMCVGVSTVSFALEWVEMDLSESSMQP